MYSLDPDLDLELANCLEHLYPDLALIIKRLVGAGQSFEQIIGFLEQTETSDALLGLIEPFIRVELSRLS